MRKSKLKALRLQLNCYIGEEGGHANMLKMDSCPFVCSFYKLHERILANFMNTVYNCWNASFTTAKSMSALPTASPERSTEPGTW